MNYNRRANRPDGNVYREMRRRTLAGPRRGGGYRGRSSFAWVVVVVVIVAGGATASWIFWK